MTLRKENLYLIYRYILNLLTQINYKLMLYQVCSEDKKKKIVCLSIVPVP